MTTRQKVAAKYVNVLDRVEAPHRTPPLPVVVITHKRASVPQFRVDAFVRDLKAMFANEAYSEFDDRTLADLVGSGLQGE